jgi:hypothetical protein
LLFKGTAYEEPILVSKDGAKIVFNLGTYTGNRYHSLANTLEQLKTPLDNSVDISVKVYEGDLFQGLVEVTFTKP